jgi:hypothetical protein
MVNWFVLLLFVFKKTDYADGKGKDDHGREEESAGFGKNFSSNGLQGNYNLL